MIDSRRFVLPFAMLFAFTAPLAAQQAGPFPFKAPAPGTVLIYNDGFQIAFGKTSGQVTKAFAGPKDAPRAAEVEFEDAFMMRRLKRGRRTLTVKASVDSPGFWPLVPGATRRFRMDIYSDGKLRQSQRGVATVAKSATTLMLAGKKRRVIRVDLDVRWQGKNASEHRVQIAYFHDLDIGFYVKRTYTRYGAEGRPRTPQTRELTRVVRVKGAPKRQ